MVDVVFKNKLITQIKSLLVERIEELQLEVKSSGIESADSFKSSAGDKHEVGRAMAMMELEKLQAQLSEKRKMLHLLDSISLKPSSKIGIGSVVKTDKGMFLILVPFGKVEMEGQLVFVISEQSPLAREFSGKSIGDDVSFNTQKHHIQQIV